MAVLTLFCLIDGTDTFFPVDIDRAQTVGHLKKLIKSESSNYFDLMKIDAAQLTLWRVSIPDDDDLPTLLKSLNDKQKLSEFLSDKEKLKATTKLSNIFDAELPEDTIHIIVQRPLPAQASTSLPSATHMQLKSVQDEDIEKELAAILEAVNDHTIHVVDAKAVETYQRQTLGRFFKRTLPHHQTATDVSLVMLGLELDKEAKTTDGKTLRTIIEGDMGKTSDLHVVAMVATSGSGKTATVFDLATRHFVIYCVCGIPFSSYDSPGFKDSNFIRLAEDANDIYDTIIHMPALQNPLDIDNAAKSRTGERIRIEILARLLFLQLLLDNNPGLEPRQFFLEQTNGGAATIRKLVVKLKEYSKGTIQLMLDKTQAKVRVVLQRRQLGLVIALDEAQLAETGILANKFISPSALSKGETLFDSKGQIQQCFRRGFLTPLSATLSEIQATLVILGTSLTLQNADHVSSAIAKETNFIKITDFPRFNEEDVNKMISNLVDMSDCDIPPAKRRRLCGRARFTINVVQHLVATGSNDDDKQAILNKAVDGALDAIKSQLRDGVRTILKSDKTGEAAHLLARMILAYEMNGGKISFPSNEQSDYVDKALCKLRLESDRVHYVMDEPLVVEVVEEELKAVSKDHAFLVYMKQLHGIIATLGAKSSPKGNALEPLIRRSLQRFNGFKLVDLPFLQGMELPKWCDDLKLQIDEVNTANGFGYTGGVAADLAFLAACPPGKMLIPSSGTRPDGLWFFPDTRYAGSLAVKFFSGEVPQDDHKSNKTSSDIRACFLKADGTVNKNLANIRRDFARSTTSKLKGTLRIHLEFPHVKNFEPVPHVLRNSATGAEDVMVYINCSNMNTFFDETIAENKDEMINLKRLIKFVTEKP
ncbi:MAG: hypothetical protein J3Q66DRAFT_298758 [Benniella sp.]|nr:MAG: hypothetical protein J3Q66DRAFT_298758 [Benniella sp.]